VKKILLQLHKINSEIDESSDEESEGSDDESETLKSVYFFGTNKFVGYYENFLRVSSEDECRKGQEIIVANCICTLFQNLSKKERNNISLFFEIIENKVICF
jgi:hypothetical protein